MARGSLFGERPVGAVTLVETPVSRSYAKKARVAFIVVSLTVWGMVTAALSLRMNLALAIVLGVLTGTVVGFVVASVVRIWPLLRMLWHWSLEISIATGVLLLVRALAGVMPAPLVLLVVLAPLAALWSVPRTRRVLSALVWCAVVRHRLRVCFAGFVRAANRLNPATMPLILIARPTPAGERVWVWLRPGLDLDDLDGKTNKIAVTCWAGEVRVVRASPRYAALIRIDVTHRDPLTGQVRSPLAQWFSHRHDEDAPVSPGLAPVGLDLDDVPEPPAETPRARR
jgi:hypothetical protein